MKIILRALAGVVIALLCTSAAQAAGSLKLTLRPTAAANSGAQWRVDGGPWKNSGITVNSLVAGPHTVEFKSISGWITPAQMTATIVNDQTADLSVAYVPTAALQIALSPASGQWRVDGGSWRTSGTTVTALTSGSHTVDYFSVAGYAAPPSETVTLFSDQTVTLSRAYTQLASVTVTLTPSGAQWRIDGGGWRNSGATATNLALGTHTIDYAPRAGYLTPSSESITLAAGQVLSLTRNYSQPASVVVTLSPTNGQWRIDGGTWLASGATAANLATGEHTIDYSALSGYATPPSETVTLISGQTSTLTRSYPEQLGSVSVSLTPSTAQWRVDGGGWLASGATAANLAPGTHTINYTAVAGYSTPSSESITVAVGQSLTLTRNYIQLASIAVTLNPTSTQWRVDGGAWQASGSSAYFAPGSHTIEYAALSGWAAPAAESVTLTAGQGLSLTRYYIQLAQVTVMLAPAGAQWRIDGGAWQAGGATVANLMPGLHTIDYAPLAGYIVPDPLLISFNPGQALVLEPPYLPLGQLTITLTPANGQWRINGGAWQASGATLANLVRGDYTIEYLALADWTPPPVETTWLGIGQSLVLTRDYTPKPASLAMTISPANAQWQLGNGPSNSGTQTGSATLTGLSPGNYTITYLALAGYNAPPAENITLAPNQQAAVTRDYTAQPPQSPQITLVTNPSSGQWRIYPEFGQPSDTWNASGATVTGLGTTSRYTIEYSSLTGYTSPRETIVVFVPGEAKTLTANYYPLPALVGVTLTPSTGQYRIDGGEWIPSGGYLTTVNAGNHTIEFSNVSGYITPAPQTIVCVPGETKRLSFSYVAEILPSITVNLVPSSGQWRVDGGAWLASGVTASNLAAGSHTVELSAVAGYMTPGPIPVTLAAGQTYPLTYHYTSTTSGYTEIATLPDLGSQGYLIRGSDGVVYGITYTQGGNGGGTLFRTNPDGTSFALLRSFPAYTNDGLNASALLEGSDGWLYGATQYGGSATNRGILFRASRDGKYYTILRVFATAAEGLSPSSLLEASDGLLYGTTSLGGTSDVGVIFRQNKDGTGYTVLRHFSSMSAQGRYAARLTESADGGLYGTISTGGTGGVGFIYRINKDGSGYAEVKTFNGGADGASPRVPLLRGSDGLLYGSTSSGGTFDRGTAFRLNADGTGHLVLKNFAGDTVEGGAPASEFTESGGLLYGATVNGGPGARGSVFKMNRDGTGFVTLKSFVDTLQEGGSIQFSPVVVGGGTITGVSRIGGAANEGTLFRLGTDGSGFSVLQHLGAPNGSQLMTPVVEGVDGALYGTSYTGGFNREGTVFKVNKDGTGLAVLRKFSGLRPSIAQSMISASDGRLYGTASKSGASGGEVFRINPDGSGLTTIRSFEGDTPQGVTEGSDGLLYGTSDGTVFKMNKDGAGFVVLRTFAGADGRYPYAGVIEGTDGLLYGTTSSGGSANLGTIYRLAKDGSGSAVLKHFTGATDGATPYTGVLFGSDGQLYGSTSAGGSVGSGVLYKLNPNGSGFTVLHHFLGGTDGAATAYGVIVDHNGTLYGTTTAGGAFSRGTLFKLQRDGSGYTTLLNFGANLSEGSVPAAALFRASDGNLYGTTFHGGIGCVIFRFGPN